MRYMITAAVLAASLMQFSALAQTRVFPQHFMWQAQPENIAFADSRFAPMISVPLFENYDGPYECYHDPDDAARVVRIKLLEAMALDPGEHWMLPDGSNVCIILPYFGHMIDSYPGCGTLPADMRFKLAADSLPGFPQQLEPFAADHPYLINTTTSGPMRAWMQAFVVALKAEVIAHNLPDPNNYRFYFDTEAHVSTEGTLPSVYMLWHLFHQRPDIWTGWKVPGSPGWQPHADHATNPTGKTFAQMYADMVAATAATPDPTDNWPADFSGVLDTASLPQEYPNLPYMVWFYSICDRAEDAVMRASAYDVLRHPVTGWPFARCGNYNAARFDGLTDAMPTPRPSSTWFADKSTWAPTLDPASPGNWSWTVTPTLTRRMPRAWFDPQPSATLMSTCNVSDRWLTLRRWSSGTACSPELYPLSTIQWEGRPWVGHKGHWSLNPYVPEDLQHPALGAFPSWPANGAWSPLHETQAQTRARIQRHTTEAVIASGGPGYPVQSQRLTPWVNQFLLVGADTAAYRTAEREHRIMLAMLRAKNVPEIISWLPPGVDPQGPPAEQAQGWINTRDVVRRVWAAEVREVGTVIGSTYWQCPAPSSPAPYSCPSPTASEKAAMVEYTLADNSGFDIVYPVVATNEVDSVVRFVIEIPAEFASGYDFEVNLECFLPGGAFGELSVRSAQSGLFVPVPTIEQFGGPPYLFDADTAPFAFDPGSPVELLPMRRTFVIRNTGQFVLEPDTKPIPLYPYYHIELRCRIDVSGATMPEVRYDLLQVIPVRHVFNPLGEETDGFAIADVTLDGVTDERDLTEFLAGLPDGQIVSDLNSDGIVDHLDVELFIDSYTSPQ